MTHDVERIVRGRCTCRNVGIGTYANQEPVTTPTGKLVGIDRCILNDVRQLWHEGVETIESCCGHGQTTGYIAVASAHHRAMLDRGWTPDPRVSSRGIFQWPQLP